MTIGTINLSKVYPEEHLSVLGTIVNGTSGQKSPANLTVTLHIINEDGEVKVFNANTDSDGGFKFADLPNGSTYSISVNYHNIAYSKLLEVPLNQKPVTLKVFEPAHSLEAITINDHILFIRDIDVNNQKILFLEIVGLTNQRDRVFIPSVEDPSKMNFLRFSLPTGFNDLDVSSSLESGQIINVGTGFGITSPVLPGIQQITYTYNIPYENPKLPLSYTFHQGVDSFQIVGPLDISIAKSSNPLDHTTTSIEDQSFSIWGTDSLAAGQTVTLELHNLPQPSLWSRVTKELLGGSYLAIWTPILLSAFLITIIIYSLNPNVIFHIRRLGRFKEQPHSDNATLLLNSIAKLDDLYLEDKISEKIYLEKRRELKEQLLIMLGGKQADKNEIL